MTIDLVEIADPKKRGEWAELRFMARAAEYGLCVNKPWGDSSPYDFAIECGGRFLRVQVKSTRQMRKNTYFLRLREYTDSQIDFFAVYIIPKDVWFIVPIDVAMRTPGSLTFSPHLERSKHARYKEAWHLLRGSEVMHFRV